MTHIEYNLIRIGKLYLLTKRHGQTYMHIISTSCGLAGSLCRSVLWREYQMWIGRAVWCKQTSNLDILRALPKGFVEHLAGNIIGIYVDADLGDTMIQNLKLSTQRRMEFRWGVAAICRTIMLQEVLSKKLLSYRGSMSDSSKTLSWPILSPFSGCLALVYLSNIVICCRFCSQPSDSVMRTCRAMLSAFSADLECYITLEVQNLTICKDLAKTTILFFLLSYGLQIDSALNISWWKDGRGHLNETPDCIV